MTPTITIEQALSLAPDPAVARAGRELALPRRWTALACDAQALWGIRPRIVAGLRRLITGGDLAPVWQGSAVLAAFTVGALALTTLAARGRQVVRMKDLHPELSL